MGIKWINQNPKKTLIIFNILFSLVILLLTDKMITLITQNVYPNTKRFIVLREIKPLTDIHIMPDNDEMLQTDTLIKKKYRLRTDANGFIMPSVIHDQPDIVLAFLGGSTTACLYVDEDKRFPFLVGRLIEEHNQLKVNSFNAGMDGNNTLHLIDILLNKVIPVKPNIVFMMENFNDMITLLYEKTYWNKKASRPIIVEIKPSLGGIIKDLLEMTIPNLSRVIQQTFFITNEWQHVEGKKIIIDKEQLLDDFELNLQTFINICKVRNIIPVLMTQANRLKETPDPVIMASIDEFTGKHAITYNELKELYGMFNQKIREVGKKENITVIDLAKEVPQEKTYMYDTVHLNDHGCIFVSKIICDNLDQFSLFDKNFRTGEKPVQ